MHFNIQKKSQEVCEIARRLYNKNMLAAGDGNISYRVSDDLIIITPTGVSKAFLHPDEMAIMTLENKIIKGSPSSERLMHLEVYKKCPEAKAVVHAHPPTAIAWSVAFPELKELPAKCLSEVILATDSIPFVPYARPGQIEMGTHLLPFLPQHRALILARHGALTWGESLDEAWMGMERIEHSAQILAEAQKLHSLSELPEAEVQALLKMREKIGPRLL